jgi:hypothetical protein
VRTVSLAHPDVFFVFLILSPLCSLLLSAGDQAAALRAQHRTLLAALRPEAVSLVDAFGWEEYALNSALGRGDGDVYRALLDMAQVGWFLGLAGMLLVDAMSTFAVCCISGLGVELAGLVIIIIIPWDWFVQTFLFESSSC